MSKKVLVTLLKYLLGFLLLGFVVWRYWKPEHGTGIQDALQSDISYLPLLAGCAICTLALMITFVRWWVLVRAQELPFSLFEALRLGFIGFYLSPFLPGSIGGDLLKAAFIAKDQKRRTVAVATVVIDRILGLCGLVWLVAVLGGGFWLEGSLENKPNLQLIVSIAGCITLGSFAFWFGVGFLATPQAERISLRLGRIPKLGHSLAEAWRACWVYRQRGGSVALALGMSMVGHVGFVLTYYFAALALFGADKIPSLKDHFLIIPIGMTIQAIPLTPGGLGIGEEAFGALYKIVGGNNAEGVMMCFVNRMIGWFLGLLSYIAYLCMKPRKVAVPNPTPENLATSDA